MPSEDDEDYIDMGSAILAFYSTLVDLLGRCAPSEETIKVCLDIVHNWDATWYSETWITQTAGDHQKSLSYEKFELRVMLSLCFIHVATVASPFCSSVFHFLAKLS